MKKLMKKFFPAVIIFFAILIYWPLPAQADDVGCGFTNLLYPTYMGTDGGTAVCYSSSTQCLGYYFMLSAESDVSIKFTQGGWFINLFKGDDYEPSSAYAWMKSSYSGRLAAGKWGVQACPKANEQFKLVVAATPYSAPSTPPPSTPTKKSNGESCAANAECDSNNCRNWLCCESGRLCCSSHSQCTSGQYCGDTDAGNYCLPKRSNGVGCSADAMCEGGYCADGVCASAPAPWCGDNVCNGSETCSTCYSDCGDCPSSEETVQPYCGDGYCNSSESCSSCSSDCSACEKETKILEIKTLSSAIIDKKGGATQDLSIFFPAEYWKEMAKDVASPKAIKAAEKELISSLKKFKLDVKSAKLKVDSSSRALSVNLIYLRYAFPPNSYPEMEGYDDYWILPTVAIGNTIEQGAICKMDEHKIEVKGRVVLLEGKQTQAMESAEAIVVLQQQFNQAFTLPKEAVDIRTDEEKCVIGYKLTKKKIGEKAASSSECQSGFLSKGKCAEPQILALVLPMKITIKRGNSLSVPITIQNIGNKPEVILAENIFISEPIPPIIEVDKTALRVYKQTLTPGELVSSESEQLEESIEKPILKAKKSGTGKLTLKFNYVADGRLTSKEETISVTVSKEHFRASKEASELFKKKMIWEEIRQIQDKQYVFVKPEDDPQFEGSLYNWQQAHAAFSSGVDGLIESAADTLKPDLYSFAETVKGLNEAQTPQQITEKTIKFLIPSSLQFGATFTGLMAPFAKQQKEEQSLLKAFGAKNLVYIPDYDENGSFRGYIVAITKEKGGKVYAVKLGNL